MTPSLDELQKLLGEALEPLEGAVYADGRDVIATFRGGSAFDLATVSPLGEMAAQPASEIARLIAWLLVNGRPLLERLAKAEEERDAAQARVAVLEGYLRTILDIDREAPEFGLCDCIDNEGEHYKSADLESVLIDARQALEPTHDRR